MPETILIVNHNDTARIELERVVAQSMRYRPIGFRDVAEAVERIQEKNIPEPDIAIIDGIVTRQGAEEVIRSLHNIYNEMPVLLLAPFGEEESSRLAFSIGVDALLSKPVSPTQLLLNVQQCIKMKHIRRYVAWLEHVVQGQVTFRDLVGHSASFKAACAQAEQASHSNLPVWIHGERGSGKELLARAIAGSGRFAGRSVVVAHARMLNASGDESALFGREGAFPVLGKLREAEGGTLIITGMDALSTSQQQRLSDALQSGVFTSSGSSAQIPLNVRLCCTSLRTPEAVAASGMFNPLLVKRLSGITIALPALRDRAGDALVLADHFLCMHTAMEGKFIRGFSAEARHWVASQHWQRNVHELEQTVRRAVAICEHEVMHVADLAGAKVPSTRTPTQPGDISAFLTDASGHVKKLKSLEAEAILFALEQSNGCMTRAARSLGIGRSTLYRKLDEQNIRPQDRRDTQAMRPISSAVAG